MGGNKNITMVGVRKEGVDMMPEEVENDLGRGMFGGGSHRYFICIVHNSGN